MVVTASRTSFSWQKAFSRRPHTLLPCLLVMTTLVSGWPALKAQTLAGHQALEDLSFLRQSILTYNPALPHYHPGFEDLSSRLLNTVPEDSISLFDFFSRVCELSTLSHEGHFSLGQWEDTVHRGFSADQYAYLPITILILSGQLFVWTDHSHEQLLRKGDRILAINGQSAEEILAQLRKVTPSDGHIFTYANRNIETGFPWLYYLHIARPTWFHIEYISSSGERKTAKIQALVQSVQQANYRKLYPTTAETAADRQSAFHDLRFEANHAVLKLPSFDHRWIAQHKVKSGKMYAEIFRELAAKNVNTLVIDLRNNTGGRNEFADDIVPFIMKPSAADPFLKKTVSWKGKEKTYRWPKPSRYAFGGHIYVLVNGKTYSAGSILARYLKEHADATIIGEETGSRYEGFAAGSSESVTLPHSGLRIGIPRYHLLFPPSNRQTTSNRGVLPDHEVVYTFRDIQDKRDLEYEKALALINDTSR